MRPLLNTITQNIAEQLEVPVEILKQEFCTGRSLAKEAYLAHIEYSKKFNKFAESIYTIWINQFMYINIIQEEFISNKFKY